MTPLTFVSGCFPCRVWQTGCLCSIGDLCRERLLRRCSFKTGIPHINGSLAGTLRGPSRNRKEDASIWRMLSWHVARCSIVYRHIYPLQSGLKHVENLAMCESWSLVTNEGIMYLLVRAYVYSRCSKLFWHSTRSWCIETPFHHDSISDWPFPIRLRVCVYIFVRFFFPAVVFLLSHRFMWKCCLSGGVWQMRGL